jgi:hypothetical protein
MRPVHSGLRQEPKCIKAIEEDTVFVAEQRQVGRID